MEVEEKVEEKVEDVFLRTEGGVGGEELHSSICGDQPGAHRPSGPREDPAGIMSQRSADGPKLELCFRTYFWTRSWSEAGSASEPASGPEAGPALDLLLDQL